MGVIQGIENIFSQKDVELNRTRDLAQKRKMIRQNSKYNLLGKPAPGHFFDGHFFDQ